MATRSNKLLVAIDLGNTTASYGVFRGLRILKSGALHLDVIPQVNRMFSSTVGGGISYDVIISSVVPTKCNTLIKSLRRSNSINRVYILGQNIKLRLPMKYSRKQLGADRLANVYGALIRFKAPCLVVDFGTAITFDLISKKGVYEGGLIVPGVLTSGRAVGEKAALLPAITLPARGARRSLIGRNTREAMQLGLLNGFGALADGLIKRYRGKIGGRLKVVATGGFACRLSPYMKHVDRVEPLHTIKSLALIYAREIKKE
jgi:type III pantothenate kinase